MPIYEYQCTECGKKIQCLQPVGEDSSGESCESCGEGVLKKVFSLFATKDAGTGSNIASCTPSSSSPFS